MVSSSAENHHTTSLLAALVLSAPPSLLLHRDIFSRFLFRCLITLPEFSALSLKPPHRNLLQQASPLQATACLLRRPDSHYSWRRFSFRAHWSGCGTPFQVALPATCRYLPGPTPESKQACPWFSGSSPSGWLFQLAEPVWEASRLPVPRKLIYKPIFLSEICSFSSWLCSLSSSGLPVERAATVTFEILHTSS